MHFVGIVLWGQAAEIRINKILKLQQQALRLLYFGEYTSHTVPFYLSTNTLPFEMLYIKIYMYFNALHISNLFVSSKEIHKYKTRFSLLNNYQVKYSRLNKLSKSFAKTEVRIWNSLPLNLRNLPKRRLYYCYLLQARANSLLQQGF
jgi:hypothetical protein